MSVFELNALDVMIFFILIVWMSMARFHMVCVNIFRYFREMSTFSCFIVVVCQNGSVRNALGGYFSVLSIGAEK